MTRQLTPEPIVIVVDFSRASESALLLAAGLDDTTSATPVVVLHVRMNRPVNRAFTTARG